MSTRGRFEDHDIRRFENPPIPHGRSGGSVGTDNPWNTDISRYPVHGNSEAYIASIGLDARMHPDFGTVWEGAPIGIPYTLVGAETPRQEIEFEYADESDNGPYPIPDNIAIEGGPDSDGDRHIIILDPAIGKERVGPRSSDAKPSGPTDGALGGCRGMEAEMLGALEMVVKSTWSIAGSRITLDTAHGLLYEVWHAYPPGHPENPLAEGWYAGSGAIFNLSSNELRPDGWTSADAAGLPIFPGLVRYEEAVKTGEIRHALRFTAALTQRAYINPATHQAGSSTDANLPPMGLRVRLKADFDTSGFSAEVKVILHALKTYGMILADNGSNWYLSGAPDSRWIDENLAELHQLHGSDFEAVQTGELHH